MSDVGRAVDIRDGGGDVELFGHKLDGEGDDENEGDDDDEAAADDEKNRAFFELVGDGAEINVFATFGGVGLSGGVVESDGGGVLLLRFALDGSGSRVNCGGFRCGEVGGRSGGSKRRSVSRSGRSFGSGAEVV